MTNKTNYSPEKYGCNGSTVDFTFSFKILESEDLIILLENDTTREQTTLELYSDYTVDYDDVGGSITTKTVYPEGYNIIISRNTSFYQGKSFSTSTGFQASEVEKSFDRASINVQDLSYTLQRSIKIPVGAENVDINLPTPIAGKGLRVNDTATGFEYTEYDPDIAFDDCKRLRNEAETQANIATNKATTATTQAGIATTQANIAIQKAQETTQTASKALTDITELKNLAIGSIQSQQNTSVSAVNNAKTDAVDSVVAVKNDAINTIKNDVISANNSAKSAEESAKKSIGWDFTFEDDDTLVLTDKTPSEIEKNTNYIVEEKNKALSEIKAETSKDVITLQGYVTQANQAKIETKTHADNASSSASDANRYATNALNSAGNANTYASNANSYANSSYSSASNASRYEQNAQGYALQSSNSAKTSKEYADVAKEYAEKAKLGWNITVDNDTLLFTSL